MKKIYYIVKIFRNIKTVNNVYTIDNQEDASTLCRLLNKYKKDESVDYRIVEDEM